MFTATVIIAFSAAAALQLPGRLEEIASSTVEGAAHSQTARVAATPAREAGAAYYGQPLPGVKPERFGADLTAALGIVRAPVFSADGTEMFWARSVGRHKSVLVTSRLLDGAWTSPAPMPFSAGDFFDHNPALSQRRAQNHLRDQPPDRREAADHIARH